jgi:hypothetical protein
MLVALALGITAPDARALAESEAAAAPSHGAPPSSDTSTASAELRRHAAELVVALHEYRTSLERLLVIHERALARATEAEERRQELYGRGLISRRELEDAQQATATARQDVERAREAIDAADHATAEAKATETLAALPPLPLGGQQHTAALSRYRGPATWSLEAGTSKLQHFFSARFGRALPVSAFGQTPLHDRMGFDHHNALDVAVHPDSPEGKALMEYLRAEGIPFIAWRSAVPGAASGAHIHVGQPSPRIAGRR